MLSIVPGAEHLINFTLHFYYKRVIFFVCVEISSTDVQILIVNVCIDDLLPSNYDF